ncbi:MAG: hypothetical protein ABJH28_05140 [Paraglaciecola sp.]|uniref:hypothetical protein n=1 Tax=Paraglaciecola sp. TaxID=1920173 RepID=UPI0032631966
MNKDDIKVPFSIRMSRKNQDQLKAKAKRLGLSVGKLVEMRVLNDTSDEQIDYLLAQADERDHGAKIIAILGREQYGNNLNQIAKSLHCGTFTDTPDVLNKVEECSVMLAAIRHHQMKEQGLRKP